jgi:glycosyltransferase involved in cell wall biosynthesis
MKIVYDPKQHFHNGFHKPMLKSPPDNWIFNKGHINYFFRQEMTGSKESVLSKQVLMIGIMEGSGSLIFSPHTLLTNSASWIVDVEHVDWFFMNTYLDIPEDKFIFDWKVRIAQKILESDACKKILCRSKMAIYSIRKLFHSECIDEKCVLFYPVQPLRPLVVNNEKTVTLGIIISAYADCYRKGGDVALKVLSTLRNKYKSLELIYVGQLPRGNIFYNPEKTPGLVHLPNLPHEQITDKILPKIDILLFPSRADTFGTVALEAMSYGKPVVANTGQHVYGLSEIIDDGKNGFCIKLPTDNLPTHANTQNVNLSDFIRKTDLLVSNLDLRKKIGIEAREVIKNKLSIDNMNRILSKIEI